MKIKLSLAMVIISSATLFAANTTWMESCKSNNSEATQYIGAEFVQDYCSCIKTQINVSDFAEYKVLPYNETKACEEKVSKEYVDRKFN